MNFKSFLDLSFFYALLQRITSKSSALKFTSIFYNVKPNSKVIDIGCGPGSMLQRLNPNIDYLGIDVSSQYINTAKKKFGLQARFFCGETNDFITNPNFKDADVIICNCMLHHLNDQEVKDLFSFVKKNIKSNTGRFLSIEPTHLIHEGVVSKWFMNRDRGEYVRTEADWKIILEASNPDAIIQTQVATALALIPYIYILIEINF